MGDEAAGSAGIKVMMDRMAQWEKRHSQQGRDGRGGWIEKRL